MLFLQGCGLHHDIRKLIKITGGDTLKQKQLKRSEILIRARNQFVTGMKFDSGVSLKHVNAILS